MNDFNPATFLLVTGTSEDGGEEISEEKQRIIRNVFNNISSVIMKTLDSMKLMVILPINGNPFRNGV